MCDEHTEDDNKAFFAKAGLGNVGELSRRGFTVLAAGGLAACASGKTASGETLAVVEQDVEITTPDGVADAYFVHPAKGKHAAVLIWPDIMGLRPAFRQMGKRLAESGYSVLVVNPFYRKAKGVVFDAATEKFTDPAVRGRLVPLMQSLTATTQTTDAVAFVGWLDKQKAVDTKRKVGTTGYCMGGPIVMRTAAALPDRIGAGGSFHGGGLVTQAPDSPHLGIPKMKASFLIAVAVNDDERDPKSKDVLKETFAANSRPAEIEVYPAQHGWCPPDSAVYDEAQAEKAWSRMMALFETALA